MFFCWAFQLEFMPTQILWSTQNLCSTPYLWHDALCTNNLHSKDWYGWLRSLILWWIKAAMSRHCSPGDVTVAKVGKRPCKYNWKQYNQPIGKSFWTNGWNICTSNVLASTCFEHQSSQRSCEAVIARSFSVIARSFSVIVEQFRETKVRFQV